jgi:cytoskeletal protein CcmA (bactofilin family)
VVGEFESNADLVLSGTINGHLRVQRDLRIMSEATVDGEVEAERIMVMGTVTGTLTGLRSIEICSGAVVTGDVVTPRIQVHEGVLLNANVHMAGPPAPPRHYLLPALLKSYAQAPQQAMEETERAAETLLGALGFELETRAQRVDKSGTLRPIFRSRDAVPYRKLRENVAKLARVLRSAAGDADPALRAEMPQGTGASGARELANALSRLRRAALVVGPVAMTRFDENPGAQHLAVYERTNSLPEAIGGPPPDPAGLLMSLQQAQHDILNEIGGS